MKIANDVLAAAAALADEVLLARVHELARNERCATAELIAHLAELDGRPSLYVARGYSSLFDYCTRALDLSEDAAYNRIEAARAARRFPMVLGVLAEGAVSLTAVRMLGRHLTANNHAAVLADARGKSKRDVEMLVARLAPRPDVRASVRRLPAARRSPAPVAASPAAALPTPQQRQPVAANQASAGPVGGEPSGAIFTPVGSLDGPRSVDTDPFAAPRTPRPIVQPTAPARYRVQFAIGQETYDKLRRLQDLLAREIPGGDPAAVFDRAITVLLAQVEKAKGFAPATPAGRSGTGGTRASSGPRPASGPHAEPGPAGAGARAPERPSSPSRHIPVAVRRAVWRRDGGRCAFVGTDGRRCAGRRYLEFHHRRPFALGGEASLDNISVRCRTHNVHEAEQVFGRRRPDHPRGSVESDTRHHDPRADPSPIP